MTRRGWDLFREDAGWRGHCWRRFRRHTWVFLAYRHWPSRQVDVCAHCGRTREVTR